MSCFIVPPLSEVDGIPVFSEIDEYVENYHQISIDHVAAIVKSSDNPWIGKLAWEEMELSTLAHVVDAIKERNESAKILDVGVGLGRLLEKVRSSGFADIELFGMDISLPYLKLARAKNLNVVMARIEDIPYKKEYFDIITCTDVLEHVVDLNLCVANILSCLKPGGTLIVRVPNREDLSSYLNENYPYQLAHLRGFDEFSLELMFTRIFKLRFVGKSAGLMIENSDLIKYNLPVYGYRFAVRSLLKIIKVFSSRLHRRLVRALYHPTEVNFVVQKPY